MQTTLLFIAHRLQLCKPLDFLQAAFNSFSITANYSSMPKNKGSQAAIMNMQTHTQRESRMLHQSQSGASPDILVAVDVDSVELMLEVFVLYICHVVDHF